MIKGERWHRRTQKKKQNERRKENEEEWRGKEQKEGKRNRIESTKPLRDYIDEKSRQVNTTQHHEGVRKSRLGKSKGAPFSFPFSFSLFFRRIRSLLDSSSAILIVIPRLSLSRGKKEKWDVLFWLLWLPTDGAQKQMVLVPPLYGSYIQPRNYLTRITLQTGIEDWRMTRVVAS
jgi:hypothetical protein